MLSFEQNIRTVFESFAEGNTFDVYNLLTEPEVSNPSPWSQKNITHLRRRLILVTARKPTPVFACGIEIYEYEAVSQDDTTGPTIYISKVDTTGCSPVKNVTAQVIRAYLRSVGKASVYIFARSQPQYIFANSRKFAGKVPLSDRGLIRWWYKLLSDPELLREGKEEKQETEGTLKSWWRWLTGASKKGAIEDEEQTQEMENADAKPRAWWYVPGIDDKVAALREIGNTQEDMGIAWNYGYPYEPKAIAKQVIPQFEDDAKSRLLSNMCSFKKSEDEEEITVQDFWNLLGFTEECGSGKLTCFFTVNVGSSIVKEAAKEGVQGDTYTNLWNTLMESDYSSVETAQASTAVFIERWNELLPKWKPLSIDSKGPCESVSSEPAVQHKEKQEVTVNVLSNNLVKRKQVPENGNTLTEDSTNRKASLEDANTLPPDSIKRKSSLTSTKRKAAVEEPSQENIHPTTRAKRRAL
ncbi:hypothetical protein EC973_005219 [Apophysomyces ossiformis]|uniref:histone acetyltransferase n=1 Tax=Apophysomyces ossiformis TaxID=679940 RepID=A0A8H7BY09_9FUNG|nr:hypothetical protein EC973_005219 [Apophysomyces ossiformis]